ncbi:hypothetical protein BGZ72_000272 [Mortierella alpina]|nr:hypothetical protein BGZ72_000272 [Mortierella alpina]
MGRTTTSTATVTTTRRSTRLAVKVEDKAPKVEVTPSTPPKSSAKSSAKASAKTATKPTRKATTKPATKTEPKTAAKKAGKAAAKPTAKTSASKAATTTKKTVKAPAAPKLVKAKKQTPSEPAAPRQRKRKQDQVDSTDDTPAAKPAKRPRKSRNAQAAAINQETDVEMIPAAAALARPSPRNRTDPCEMLPTEVWHQVLSLLPLSQAATSSLVSKTWLDGARAWPVWKQICETLVLGKPKRKYKTYMSVVCAHSYFICDKCHSFSNGAKSYIASEIPLPVDVIVKEAEVPKTALAKGKDMSKDKNKETKGKANDKAVGKEQANDQKPQEQGQSSTDPAADDQVSGDVVERWNLCRICRTAYYREHPEDYRRLPGESEDEWEHRRSDRITKTRACSTYYLTEDDILFLDYREVRNPHHRSWHPMRLYDRFDIQDRALEIHGGWVGVDACTKGVAKARRLAYKLRDAAVLGDSSQPRKKRVKKEDASQESSQESSQGASQEATQVVPPESTQVPLLEVKEELATQLANGPTCASSGVAPMAVMPAMPAVAAGAQ